MPSVPDVRAFAKQNTEDVSHCSEIIALVYQRSYILNQEGSIYMWSKEPAHQKFS